jgi:hypothetical protein
MVGEGMQKTDHAQHTCPHPYLGILIVTPHDEVVLYAGTGRDGTALYRRQVIPLPLKKTINQTIRDVLLQQAGITPSSIELLMVNEATLATPASPEREHIIILEYVCKVPTGEVLTLDETVFRIKPQDALNRIPHLNLGAQTTEVLKKYVGL